MTVFEQIGQKLKMARESKGLSLGQIYDKTKISTANLEAIEAGDLEELPEPVYVSGFIKRYAECVGLNGQNLTEEFRQASDDKEDRSEKSAFISGWGGKGVAVQQQPIVHSSLSKAKIAPPKPSIAKLVFYPAFLIIIIVGLISYLFYYQQMQFKAKDPSIVALEQSTSRFSPANVSTEETKSDSETNSEAEEKKAKEEKDNKISLTASKHVWVEVRALSTGNSLFTGYLEAGDRRDYEDPQGLKVRAGNGGSLNVSFKGKHETFGAKGKPITRSFATKSASDASTQVSSNTQEAKPAPAPKPRRVVTAAPKPKPKPKPKKIQRTPSRYIPGESVGGRRSIGVPYRYTE